LIASAGIAGLVGRSSSGSGGSLGSVIATALILGSIPFAAADPDYQYNQQNQDGDGGPRHHDFQ